MKYKAITGREFGKEVAEKLGLQKTRRIIIDIGLDVPILIYTEQYGDERLYNINMDKLPIGIEEVKE